MKHGVEIRREQPADAVAIREVNDGAFGRPDEGALVDRLRSACDGLISLVAVLDGVVVGHVLFSPATIGELTGMALGPVAVLPEWQRQGMGDGLIAAGLAAIRETGCPFVIVLGHPTYYPRFGFAPASRHGVRCQWDVPDEVFMLLVLNAAAMGGVSGMARYHPEFDPESVDRQKH